MTITTTATVIIIIATASMSVRATTTTRPNDGHTAMITTSPAVIITIANTTTAAIETIMTAKRGTKRDMPRGRPTATMTEQTQDEHQARTEVVVAVVATTGGQGGIGLPARSVVAAVAATITGRGDGRPSVRVTTILTTSDEPTPTPGCPQLRHPRAGRDGVTRPEVSRALVQACLCSLYGAHPLRAALTHR